MEGAGGAVEEHSATVLRMCTSLSSPFTSRASILVKFVSPSTSSGLNIPLVYSYYYIVTVLDEAITNERKEDMAIE